MWKCGGCGKSSPGIFMSCNKCNTPRADAGGAQPVGAAPLLGPPQRQVQRVSPPLGLVRAVAAALLARVGLAAQPLQGHEVDAALHALQLQRRGGRFRVLDGPSSSSGSELVDLAHEPRQALARPLVF